MKRREFLLLSSVAFGATRALAQARGVRRIGFLAPLSPSTPSHPDVFYDAFVAGMKALGYSEGRNLLIDWRFAEGKFDRLPALATELAHADVEVIVTHSTPGVRALQQATRTVPIVCATVIDPVRSGFAASLAHPGGNITGLAIVDVDPNPKRLELLGVMVPGLQRVAFLVNPGTAAHAALAKSLHAVGERVGVNILPTSAATSGQIAQAFAAMKTQGIGGVIIADDAFFRGQREQIAQLSLKHRIPTVAPWREYTSAGGLMSYGQDIAESFRLAAGYVDRILKGARPGDLPIEQPSKIDLVINRATAKAIGLHVPQDLLLRADSVID